MQNIAPNSMSYNEIERIAYITGNSMLAAYASECDDQESLIEGFDDQMEAEFSRGYKEGELDTLGKDTDAMLAAQRQEIARLKTEYMALKDYLAKVKDYINGDACKKVAGRHALSADITRQYIATPRYTVGKP